MTIELLILYKAIVEAQIEAMGMVAENTIRADQGYSLAYDEKAFARVREELAAIWEANRP